MATNRPRITVTLTDRQHEVLRTISECGGQSMSAFISDILDEALPTLERMAETLRRIKTARDEQKQRIADELDRAQAAAEPLVSQVLGQFDLFMSRLESTVGAGVASVRSHAAAAAPSGALTPVTNRGVTPPLTKPRKPAPGKASRRSAAPRKSSKVRGG